MGELKTFAFWRWAISVIIGSVLLYATVTGDLKQAKADIADLRETAKSVVVHTTKIAVIENDLVNIKESNRRIEAGVIRLLRRQPDGGE